jgi:hypothetical protein
MLGAARVTAGETGFGSSQRHAAWQDERRAARRWGERRRGPGGHVSPRRSTFATFYKIFAATLALLGAALIVAPAASAAKYPQTAPLVDASGAKSGCVATAALPKLVKSRGQSLYDISVSGTCDPAWQRTRIESGLYEVAADGTQTTIWERQTIGQTQGTITILGAGAEGPCSAGPHTYISRWWLKVKQSATDPNPFKATVESRGTFTC